MGCQLLPLQALASVAFIMSERVITGTLRDQNLDYNTRVSQVIYGKRKLNITNKKAKKLLLTSCNGKIRLRNALAHCNLTSAPICASNKITLYPGLEAICDLSGYKLGNVINSKLSRIQLFGCDGR